MRIRFKRVECPFWFGINNSCPSDLTVEEFVTQLGGTLFSDDPESYVYDGIEFDSDINYTWFLLNY